MSREAHIPLALWVCAAIVAHMAGGGGASEVAQIIEDRAQIRRMVNALREELRPGDMTFEVLTDATEPTPPSAPLAPPEKPADDAAPDQESDPDAPTDPKRKPAPDKTAKPEKKKPPPPEPEPPKKEIVRAVPVVPAPPPPPAADRRIAIRQHVEKDQEDNPEASRIADDANKVAEETMAQIRSKDQDDPEPTPGTTKGPSGPKDKVGDSDHDHSGHSEERAGNEKHAPGEGKDDSESVEHHSPTPSRPAIASAPVKGAPPGGPGAPGGGARAAETPPGSPPPQKGAPGGAGPASPEVALGDRGSYTLDPANPGGDGKSRVAGKRAAPRPYESPVRVGSLGLGAPGLPGGPNLNLSMAGVEEAVGHEKLRAERAADGASRRSAHRGSWETNKWQKWRAAIENYDPSVKPGNQTSLNAARVPFATYINMIHNRLHPIFAEEFLEALSKLPKGHAFNDYNLVTHLEIVLNKDNGRIVRLGVTKPSGMTAFDIVALNSVSRASPFGKAPDAIVSPDGNVYLHWEFHRDPFDACSTRNARPFLLKTAPNVAPVQPAPGRKAPRPVPSDEKATTPAGPLLPLRR